MKSKLPFLIVFLCCFAINSYAQDDYYLKKAQEYQQEAAYYTKKGNIDKAKTYSRYARGRHGEKQGPTPVCNKS